MKNKLATYLAVLTVMVLAMSCSMDDESLTLTPYAYVKTFSIGNFKSSYPTFTESGKDTLEERTYSGASFPFTIDQVAGEIYNSDSLPYLSDISKITLDMTIEGVASIYNSEKDVFEKLLRADSLDFTYPRILRITSSDGSYSKDYSVSVNVHKVNPDRMDWGKIESPVGVVLEKAIAYREEMLLFGKKSALPQVLSMPLKGAHSSWSAVEQEGLPVTADFTTVTFFGGSLYLLADGNLYASSDAVTWNCLSQGNGFVAIIGASEEDGYMWLANTDSIYRSADGVSFEVVEALPDGFPLYGISALSYPLNHNRNIVRYVLVGYSTAAKEGVPQVWNKLSTENNWVKYDNYGNPYPCPSLAGLSVMRYGGLLYAVGGKGTAAGNDVGAFASFYISKDNGIVWKASEDYNQRLPQELVGKDVPFVSTVDSSNYMWIITNDENTGSWRGIINRLGFNR